MPEDIFNQKVGEEYNKLTDEHEKYAIKLKEELIERKRLNAIINGYESHKFKFKVQQSVFEKDLSKVKAHAKTYSNSIASLRDAVAKVKTTGK
ncbi:hypothetical protein K502DRAFT_152009 [Neoconidiobolus thromboides FSU 785]|nr:hypothetical protein K502DRAFT_152009 [Neoconidiobolus thromboides FSU 785]